MNATEPFPRNLFRAIRNGNLDEVRRALACAEYVSIDEINDDDGSTPLGAAAVSQQFEICKYFIDEREASADRPQANGRTPLIDMVRYRSNRWSDRLLNLFEKSVNSRDAGGKTALMYAAVGVGLFGSRRGNFHIATRLIEMGASTTTRDNRDRTALWWAISSDKGTKQNIDIIRLLKHEMFKEEAVRIARRDYNEVYTEKGELVLEKKPQSDVEKPLSDPFANFGCDDE